MQEGIQFKTDEKVGQLLKETKLFEKLIVWTPWQKIAFQHVQAEAGWAVYFLKSKASAEWLVGQ